LSKLGIRAEEGNQCGINPWKILLTSKVIPDNLDELVDAGVQYNACSLRQLAHYGKRFPGRTSFR